MIPKSVLSYISKENINSELFSVQAFSELLKWKTDASSASFSEVYYTSSNALAWKTSS